MSVIILSILFAIAVAWILYERLALIAIREYDKGFDDGLAYSDRLVRDTANNMARQIRQELRNGQRGDPQIIAKAVSQALMLADIIDGIEIDHDNIFVYDGFDERRIAKITSKGIDITDKNIRREVRSQSNGR